MSGRGTRGGRGFLEGRTGSTGMVHRATAPEDDPDFAPGDKLLKSWKENRCASARASSSRWLRC
jgi:hypothetical protein